ncbi:MAG TPA: succinylglutamate-semialdehyde dehydrogenase [Tepidisphaeraceae bacterium]|jgi:succinylglutamic semialdehyde dehydrogenase|nr:succinylglutamate-semialdehyde dehydrogenase [Tepidisphaeraceae bacterium]
MPESSDIFTSSDPATGETIWSGRAAGKTDIDTAVASARHAHEDWASRPLAERTQFLEAFAKQVQSRRADLIEAICRSTGKPRWESATEVDAVFGKVALTIQANNERHATTEKQTANTTAATRYKPHGVLAVFGPFNFPAHLPNGHILPALLAGNTVLFKPSEQTPLVGDIYADLWRTANLPAGVFTLLQGGRETGSILANHSAIDGLLFTGSFEAGVALNRAVVDHPGKIVALEMGGNNPLIVADVADLHAAAYWTIQSAFITAGQRCSCARRLILLHDRLIDPLIEMTRSIQVGKYTDNPEPFMGPLISPQAATRVMNAQDELLKRGAKPLLPMKNLDNRAMLSPGIIDVTDIDRPNINPADVEIFGPLLQIIRVRDFNEAIREANNTRYGLAAALFSDDRALYDQFFRRIRAGVVNWNRPTTGASGVLPFGGVGSSGNHRPSGFFAIDYCAYPVASMESTELKLPQQQTPGIDKG